VGTIDLTGTTTSDFDTGGYYLTVTKFTALGGYSGPGTPMGDYFKGGTAFSWSSTEITAMTIRWISGSGSYQIQTEASSFFASVSDPSISDSDPDGLWLAKTPSSSVPDVASTCLLLGLGLAGLAVAGRKKVAAL